MALVAAYPIGFGPACWLSVQGGFGTRAVSVVFYPILWLSNRVSKIGEIASSYAELGESEGWNVSFEGNKISWWMRGPSMMPYRTTFDGCFSDDSEDAQCETAIHEFADDNSEVE
jgi:hypothetical protein